MDTVTVTRPSLYRVPQTFWERSVQPRLAFKTPIPRMAGSRLVFYHPPGFCRCYGRKLDELSGDSICEATVRVIYYTQPFGALTLEHHILNVVRRRFTLPEANDPYHGTYNVSAYGPACTQQNSTILPLPGGLNPVASGYMNLFRILPDTPEAEDCTNRHFLPYRTYLWLTHGQASR